MSAKRIISLLVCLMVVVSMLAGCGGPANTTTAPTTAAGTTVAATETKGEPVSLIFVRPWYQEYSDPSLAANQRIREKIKEKLNIDVQIVGDLKPSSSGDRPMLMITSGEKMDMFYMNPDETTLNTLKANGNIIPLNDLLDKYGQDLKKNWTQAAIDRSTDAEGKIWALADETNPVTTALYCRIDLLEKFGLATPVTIADFENMMQTFINKNNDKGFLPGWPALLEGIFLGSFTEFGVGSQRKFLDTDGKVKPYFMQAGFKDFAIKMAEWYKKGYIHKEYYTIQYEPAIQSWYKGEIGLCGQWCNGTVNINQEQLKKNVPDGKFGIIAPPKGPTYGGLIAQGSPVSEQIFISSTSENPEACMKFLNYINGTEEGYLLGKFGEEGVDWNWKDKANNLVERTKTTEGTERYAWELFASARLNYYANKFNSNQLDAQTRQFMNDPKVYPSAPSFDILTKYDENTMASAANITALNTLIDEKFSKTIMGELNAADWDKVVQEWLDLGGTQYIDDLTAQYNAQKK